MYPDRFGVLAIQDFTQQTTRQLPRTVNATCATRKGCPLVLEQDGPQATDNQHQTSPTPISTKAYTANIASNAPQPISPRTLRNSYLTESPDTRPHTH